MPGGKTNYNKIVSQGLWGNNPVFRQILGICSTLAVTNLVVNTLVMCTALTLTLTLSAFTISMIRKWTPRNIRMMVQTLIIAFYVIIFDLILKAYWPEMSKNLGPYIGLIITNCIIMGRCEAYANTNAVNPSIVDGFFNGIGYSYILLLVALFRELLGMGTILGYPMPYFSTIWDKWIIMVMPPGAFFMLAIIIWVMRAFKVQKESK